MSDKKKNRRKKSLRRETPRFLHLNIGTVIFGALFLYLVISLVLYLTADHVESYQVVQGPLSKNETFTAFAMRQEEVSYASGSGYIHYYARNASKVSNGSVIYGLSDTEGPDSRLEIAADDSVLSSIRYSLATFSRAYDPDEFSAVSDLRYEMTQELLTEAGSTYASGNLLSAAKDGVVVFSVDGYETYTQDDLRPELFSEKNTVSSAVKTGEKISAGDPVYKLITDEQWRIAVPITEKQTVKLESYKNIKVKFLKDGKTQTGSLEIKKTDEQNYAVITLYSGMVRYAGERFLKVELVTNQRSGLKIPNTSITQKDFYTIPANMLANGDDSSGSGFLMIRTDKKGNVQTDENDQPLTEFVSATIYSKIEDENGNAICYYVDTDTFEDGAILVAPDSNTRYTIGPTVSLEGVYCINKGYAVFRKIEIVDQNEEFCIVKSQTSFGISQFDYIVQDASTVHEEEILQ